MLWRAENRGVGIIPMKTMSPLECAALLEDTAFSISEDGRLVPRASFSQLLRVEAHPNGPVASVGDFIESVIRWLPDNSGRLIWASNWAGSYPLGSGVELVLAARRSCHETRTLVEAPAHCFSPCEWTWDQVATTDQQALEGSQLVGILACVMSNGWDAWMLSDGTTDCVEFWEGNLLFYSASAEKRAQAKRLLENFGYPLGLK